ncbi:hypothetical protein ONS95_005174 [Cadophora gregata]|uniref:uncharacterized protein n=1 Tax=Cadophora gregata TaxID=51156 RepID=UPI0026DB58D0|nr:uncharacterized protein ONS95_005174 [Cadophora gregata]KAK0104911.1 hypothetical protein ONS95_005174 [Cadophora gregata]KAK0115007.1 hypothetical protein ONS96_013480 [Cadophora gregata f. sp. sojae]
MSQTTTKYPDALKRIAINSLEAPPPKRKLLWLMSQASSSTMSRRSSLDTQEITPPLNFFIPQRMVEVTVVDHDKTDVFGFAKNHQIFTIPHNVLPRPFLRRFPKTFD